MSEAYSGGSDGGATRFENRNAAAPIFAIMALLTAVLGGGSREAICSAMRGASPLSGMVPMYLLMSTIHLAPWLKLISNRRDGRPA